MNHPYQPSTLKLPHYIPNQGTTLTLVSQFTLLIILIITPSLYIITNKTTEKAKIFSFLWFMITGSIHLFFEGYYVIYHKTLAAHSTLFGELWKEYSMADSRYLSSDALVLFIEAITAFIWGPLCFLIVYQIYQQNNKRHLYVVVVSLGQLYGAVLYYLTELYENMPHCNNNSFYFWVYFMFTNSFWIFIPSYYLWDSAMFMLNSLKDFDTKNEIKLDK